VTINRKYQSGSNMAITTTADKKGQPAAGGQKALAKQDPVQQLAAIIASRKDAFALVAGKHFNPDRLIKLAHGALARTPKLAECTPASLLVALMRCAELELEPDGALPQRRMWLIPRWNKRLNRGKGAQECTYLMDYRAQIQKARETELVTSVVASPVCERDHFELHYDADGSSITKFEFEPDVFGDRGKVIGYFAAARIEGGEVQLVAMSRKQAEAFRDKYGPRNKRDELTGPWVGGDDQFDEMSMKTCLRKLWKLLPAGKSEEARRFQQHIASEGDVEEGRRSVQSTASIDLGLGLPADDEIETTADQVERALMGSSTSERQDDIQFETAAEEEKRKAAELTQKVAHAPEREPGEDDGDDEFAR
jgi:recombination protein RecT